MRVIYTTLSDNVYCEDDISVVKIVKPFLIIDNRLINLYDLRIKSVTVDREVIYLLSVEDFTKNIEEE